jgi:hypothetical protein
MNKVDLGDGSTAYYDHYCRRTFEVMKYRQIGNLLAADLLEQNRSEEAKNVIQKSLKELPIEASPDDSGNIPLLHLAYECGLKEELAKYSSYLLDRHLSNLMWFASLSQSNQQMNQGTFQQEIEKGQNIKMMLEMTKDAVLLEQLSLTYKEIGLKL